MLKQHIHSAFRVLSHKTVAGSSPSLLLCINTRMGVGTQVIHHNIEENGSLSSSFSGNPLTLSHKCMRLLPEKEPIMKRGSPPIVSDLHNSVTDSHNNISHDHSHFAQLISSILFVTINYSPAPHQILLSHADKGSDLCGYMYGICVSGATRYRT